MGLVGTVMVVVPAQCLLGDVTFAQHSHRQRQFHSQTSEFLAKGSHETAADL